MVFLMCVCTGDCRNDLYLTMERGEFERGGKSVQKNIEVMVYVLYADGEVLKVSHAQNITVDRKKASLRKERGDVVPGQMCLYFLIRAYR